MKTKTSIKSGRGGAIGYNHSQTAACVKVKSGIKAGDGEFIDPPTKPVGRIVIVKGG